MISVADMVAMAFVTVVFGLAVWRVHTAERAPSAAQLETEYVDDPPRRQQ